MRELISHSSDALDKIMMTILQFFFLDEVQGRRVNKISTSAVLVPVSQAIRGLYAAGEVTGSAHGNNRLGGNLLLDCAGFGRVAGVACAKYMLGEKLKRRHYMNCQPGVSQAIWRL